MAVRIPGINIDEYYQQLGPIEPLIRDDRVTEIMVNGSDHVYVEMGGKVVLTNIKFVDEDQLLNVIQFIVRTVGRRIDERQDEDLRKALASTGLLEISADAWIRRPPKETSRRHLARFDGQLQPARGDIPDLQILDPTRKVTFYRGRWRAVAHDTGRFVGRRPQRYGNSLWGYVELDKGLPVSWADLPLPGSVYRGCDEAWRLQAAIDAEKGHPQRYRIRAPASPDDGSSSEIHVYSPLPIWIQRHWDSLGQPLHPSAGSLFAYTFHPLDLQEETELLEQDLWLKPIDDE